MNNFEKIPSELKALKQWILWKREKLENGKSTKIPYSTFHNLASVTNPNDWSTFDSVVSTYNLGGFDGIGFVFTENDPYTGIDLDDAEGDAVIYERQLKIFKEFSSYSELSPSGKGLHIIVKGKVESGRRKSKIEIYSAKRYFTMTGNVYQNEIIVECQGLLDQLYNQMGDGKVLAFNKDKPQSLTDEQVLEYCLKNEKFAALHSGDMSLYPTPSEADFAYIDVLSFYSRNRVQIERIFRASPLMRDKVNKNKTYLARGINKSFDNMLADIDFEGYSNHIDNYLETITPIGPVAQRSEPIAHNGLVAGSNPAGTTIFPPGLTGEIAQFIYDAAPRPVKEIAIAAALGLMAGICGRAFNVNGTGLNLYILIIAKTGRGKEAAASGIDKLMNAIKLEVPTSTRYRGPGIINSGQALVKYIADRSNCFVSVLGEFGLTIERISAHNSNSADKMLYAMLLDLYNKSGHGQTFQPSIYSNKEDNVSMTESPAVTILGESTHKLFYGALNEDMISAGLLPRFLIIEYNGERVLLNEDAAKKFPTFELTNRLSTLVAHCETIQHQKKVCNIELTDDAAQMLRDFDKYSTNKINRVESEIITELWNRSHMKIWRMAGLLAVGINPYNPIITVDNLNWAKRLVENDIEMLSNKFELGEIGSKNVDDLQMKEVLKKVKDYLERDWEYVGKYSGVKSLFKARWITLEYLLRRLAGLNIFKPKGSAQVSATIKSMIEMGILKEVPRTDMKAHNTEQKAYILMDIKYISDAAL